MPCYRLSVLRHDQSSQLYTFEQAKVLIGREGGDIVTGDPKMSARHGELTFEGGVLRYTDLNSTNGTYRVSGERVVGTIVLEPGAALRLGACTLTVQEIESGLVGPTGTQVMEQVSDVAFAATALAAQAPPGLAELTSGVSSNAAAAASAPHPEQQQAQGAFAQPVGDVAAGPGVGVAPSAAYTAPSLAGSAEGLFDVFKALLRQGASIYKVQGIHGALTMGVVTVPVALVGVATGWIPIVGFLVAILLGLVQLALAPIAGGAMWRWSLAVAGGESLTWKQAWSAVLKNPVREWLNIAVMSFVTGIGVFFFIVPGLLLGMFAAPAYLLEGKFFIGANLRSMELVLKDAGRHLGLALLVLVSLLPVMIAASVCSVILGFLPVIGAPLAQLVTAAVLTVALPFVYLLWALVYFDSRKRFEGEDARTLYAPTIRSWRGD